MKYNLTRDGNSIYAYLWRDTIDYHCAFNLSGFSGYEWETDVFSLSEARYFYKDIKNKIKTTKGYRKAWGKSKFKISIINT